MSSKSSSMSRSKPGSNSKSAPNVSALLGNALGGAAAKVFNIADLGQQIQDGLGIDVGKVNSSRVMLMPMLFDDSSSIRSIKNGPQIMCDGHKLVIQALSKSKESDGILVQCTTINGTIIHPYINIKKAPAMTLANYSPDHGTPLYDGSLTMLGGVIAKTQEFLDNGVACTSASLIGSDGADLHSKRTASDCRKVIEDMLRQEIHIIAAMGVYDGSTDFYKVYTGWDQGDIEDAKAEQLAKKNGVFDNMVAKGGMGILPKWVLTPGNTESEIRRAFRVFSQSAMRASQDAGSFSQTAAGGFAAP